PAQHASSTASLPSSLYSFFFSPHADHLALHSFPTRRSSDLRRPSAVAPGATARTLDATAPYQVADAARLHDVVVAATRPAPGREDRKSTRLNSSHVSISYAVFCLKKKNQHRAGTVNDTHGAA